MRLDIAQSTPTGQAIGGGPANAAYEAAVLAHWHACGCPVSCCLPTSSGDGVMSEKAQARWRHFLAAYREVGAVSEADLAAIPLFMAVRHIWLLGEYAGQVPVWGTQAMPTDYLRRQADMLTQWENLTLPA